MFRPSSEAWLPAHHTPYTPHPPVSRELLASDCRCDHTDWSSADLRPRDIEIENALAPEQAIREPVELPGLTTDQKRRTITSRERGLAPLRQFFREVKGFWVAGSVGTVGFASQASRFSTTSMTPYMRMK
jgi:hypothetical protein